MININEITFIDGNNAFITDKETRSPNKIDLGKEEFFWHPCSHERAIEYFSTIVQHYESLQEERRKHYFEAYLQILDTTTEVGFALSMATDISQWHSLLF